MISPKNMEVLKYMAELRGTTVENVVNSLIENHLIGSRVDKPDNELEFPSDMSSESVEAVTSILTALRSYTTGLT